MNFHPLHGHSRAGGNLKPALAGGPALAGMTGREGVHA